MKYTSPIYANEKLETTDVMSNSPYSIGYVDKVVKDPVTGEEKVEKATQITVNINNLF